MNMMKHVNRTAGGSVLCRLSLILSSLCWVGIAAFSQNPPITPALSDYDPHPTHPTDDDDDDRCFPDVSAPVQFPPPLNGVQRAARALEFYKNVIPVLVAYKSKEWELDLLEGPAHLLFGRPTTLSKSEKTQLWKELDEWGSTKIAETIQQLKGFYVKTGQVISTRVDLFPEPYTSKLQELQDNLEPMPFSLVKSVVEQELLNGAPLSELFASFDTTPLGAASIAQVHKARLLDGTVVAVKLQRPNVEPKLRGDIANLKRISKILRKYLPVDYYAVFCELGDALENELDFLMEAQAMRKISMAIQNGAGEPPVTIPLPVGELVAKRVLVMDFCPGVPLNRLSETMKARGIVPGSIEAKLVGRRILKALAQAFGRMIFGAGIMHGDPHPGNIFLGQGGKVSLIDCGQFKTFSRSRRLQFAQFVLAVKDYQEQQRRPQQQQSVKDKNHNGGIRTVVPDDPTKKALADCARGFGITCVQGRESEDDVACAIALVLFSDTGMRLPGNFSSNELSPDSPIRLLTSFPQDLVLLGRATVLLKGIAKSLNESLSLVDQWEDECQRTLEACSVPSMPLWGTMSRGNRRGGGSRSCAGGRISYPMMIRLRHGESLVKQWATNKMRRLWTWAMQRLPVMRLVAYMSSRQENHEPTPPSTLHQPVVE